MASIKPLTTTTSTPGPGARDPVRGTKRQRVGPERHHGVSAPVDGSKPEAASAGFPSPIPSPSPPDQPGPMGSPPAADLRHNGSGSARDISRARRDGDSPLRQDHSDMPGKQDDCACQGEVQVSLPMLSRVAELGRGHDGNGRTSPRDAVRVDRQGPEDSDEVGLSKYLESLEKGMEKETQVLKDMADAVSRVASLTTQRQRE